MPVRHRAIALSIAATLLLAACGKSVEGSTYADATKTFKIEFQSGGKATVTIGGQPADCTYEEKDKAITVTCAGQPADFTKNDDGSLNGPAGGMLVGTLTKQ
jgi:major membrane immunogen (membrane-anchored lipoprotein)